MASEKELFKYTFYCEKNLEFKLLLPDGRIKKQPIIPIDELEDKTRVIVVDEDEEEVIYVRTLNPKKTLKDGSTTLNNTGNNDNNSSALSESALMKDIVAVGGDSNNSSNSSSSSNNNSKIVSSSSSSSSSITTSSDSSSSKIGSTSSNSSSSSSNSGNGSTSSNNGSSSSSATSGNGSYISNSGSSSNSGNDSSSSATSGNGSSTLNNGSSSSLKRVGIRRGKKNTQQSTRRTSNKKRKFEQLEEEEYFIEKILDRRFTIDGDLEFLVKWEGYGDEENSWVHQLDVDIDSVELFNKNKLEQKKGKYYVKEIVNNINNYSFENLIQLIEYIKNRINQENIETFLTIYNDINNYNSANYIEIIKNCFDSIKNTNIIYNLKILLLEKLFNQINNLKEGKIDTFISNGYSKHDYSNKKKLARFGKLFKKYPIMILANVQWIKELSDENIEELDMIFKYHIKQELQFDCDNILDEIFIK